MKQRPRIYYTESQRALMWERWQKGDTLHPIAQLFDRHHPSIARILGETGGIRPTPRRRSRLALTLAEREEISRAVVADLSMRSIAVRLGRTPSTISREIKRNGGRACYRASQAEESAWDRGRRPKSCKLAQNRALARIVAGKLQRRWSPQQIAGWLKRTYPSDTKPHTLTERDRGQTADKWMAFISCVRCAFGDLRPRHSLASAWGGRGCRSVRRAHGNRKKSR